MGVNEKNSIIKRIPGTRKYKNAVTLYLKLFLFKKRFLIKKIILKTVKDYYFLLFTSGIRLGRVRALISQFVSYTGWPGFEIVGIKRISRAYMCV